MKYDLRLYDQKRGTNGPESIGDERGTRTLDLGIMSAVTERIGSAFSITYRVRTGA
jgi:hypothetical protein